MGKPDYLLEDGDALIPVEVKPSRRAAEPYPGDVLQLLAYCLLVEEAHGRPPTACCATPNQTFRIDYTDAARADCWPRWTRSARRALAGELARSHDDPARCADCMFNESLRSVAGPAGLGGGPSGGIAAEERELFLEELERRAMWSEVLRAGPTTPQATRIRW